SLNSLFAFAVTRSACGVAVPIIASRSAARQCVKCAEIRRFSRTSGTDTPYHAALVPGREQRTKNREQRTENREQRTKRWLPVGCSYMPEYNLVSVLGSQFSVLGSQLSILNSQFSIPTRRFRYDRHPAPPAARQAIPGRRHRPPGP